MTSVTGPMRIPLYTPCPGCARDVFCNQTELTNKNVWCSWCKKFFVLGATYTASERNTTVSNHSAAYSGEYHILLRVKGPEERIAIFNHILKKCDGDWPFVARQAVRVCKSCTGIIWNAPRIGPDDIKAAARQVGGITVKVHHFAPYLNCRTAGETYNYQSQVEMVPIADARRLFRGGGPAAFRAKYTPSVVTATVLPKNGLPPAIVAAVAAAPVVPPVLEVPQPSEDFLMGEVLSPMDSSPDPASPSVAPQGSLCQFPGTRRPPVGRTDQSQASTHPLLGTHTNGPSPSPQESDFDATDWEGMTGWVN